MKERNQGIGDLDSTKGEYSSNMSTPTTLGQNIRGLLSLIFAAGIRLGTVGVTQSNQTTRKLPLTGLIANIAIIVFFVLSIGNWAIGEYS